MTPPSPEDLEWEVLACDAEALVHKIPRESEAWRASVCVREGHRPHLVLLPLDSPLHLAELALQLSDDLRLGLHLPKLSLPLALQQCPLHLRLGTLPVRVERRPIPGLTKQQLPLTQQSRQNTRTYNLQLKSKCPKTYSVHREKFGGLWQI